jgi:hypothetical protein
MQMRATVPARKRMAITLHWLARALVFEGLGDLKGLGESTTTIIVHEVVGVLHHVLDDAVAFPTTDDGVRAAMKPFAGAVDGKCAFLPHFIGAIDGSPYCADSKRTCEICRRTTDRHHSLAATYVWEGSATKWQFVLGAAGSFAAIFALCGSAASRAARSCPPLFLQPVNCV